MTKLSSTHSASTFLAIGFVIWLLATLMVRMAGQWLFVPGNWVLVVVLNLITFAAMLGLAQAIYRRFGVESEQRSQVAVWLALPGLLLDGLLSLFMGVAFPNIALEAQHLFAGWLLLAYGAVFLSTWPRR